MPIVYTAEGKPIEVSQEEYDKRGQLEDKLVEGMGSTPEEIKAEEEEANYFEKYGWKRCQGIELPDSFENEEFDDGDRKGDEIIDLPNSHRVDYGTKYTVAYDSSGHAWYIEGAVKIPQEIDTPFVSYRIYEAHDGRWEVIEEREELTSEIKHYPKK